MLREELTARLADFEGKQPVERWTWRGWHAWPVVRAHLALSLHRAEAPAAPAGRGKRLAAALAWRGRRLRRWAARSARLRPDRPADVVFLTHSDRGQRIGGVRVNTVVDPWAQEAARAGARVSVWELGDPQPHGLAQNVSIQHAVDARVLAAASAREPVPDWFREVADFVGEELAADVGWEEIARDLRSVDALAELFEPWLRAAAPRSVVLDAWYLPQRMGAALAAARLGIRSIDLQHGIQGSAHPAYAGWTSLPPEGYEVFPDEFWVWGPWDAESLRANSPGVIAPGDVRVVGNRWLAAWTQTRPAPEIAAEIRRAERGVGEERNVLVTLQKDVPFRRALVPRMREAPRDWLWRVRLHRSMRADPRHVQADLRRASGARVECVLASRLPLYALLQSCAWHVTAFSTCALEALAFGVPTLLTHESGAHAYAAFVEQGAMRVARTAAEDVALLAETSESRARACRSAARRVFAEPAPVEPLLTAR